MSKRNKISAIIPARKGSERVKNKNTKNFAGKSLLEIKIAQLLRVDCFDEIIISTDCNYAKKIANSFGDKITVHERESYYCTSQVPINEVYSHLSSICKFDHVAYIHLTSPLLKDESLVKTVEAYNLVKDPYDSVATVSELRHYIWYENKAVNYDPSKHPRSQDLPNYYCLNFAVNVLPKNVMKEKRNIVGNNFLPIYLSEIESVDVDTPLEFNFAEMCYENLHG